MTTMNAALVTSFDEPPHYRPIDAPTAFDADQRVVDVLAVGLHPRVRSGASGAHYTSTGRLPMIPGIDGVGRLADGSLVYFVAADELPGPMAERTVIDMRRTVALPAGVDVATVAASMNPAMSSWVALRHRVPLTDGQSVLVLGATGNAGTMAIQIARRLGAGRVVGAGRDPDRLARLTSLGADAVVPLTDDVGATSEMLAAMAAEADIVIDYLWGTPAARAMSAVLQAREDRGRRLDWVQIGAVAGPTLDLPSVLLRSADLRIQGVGQGSVGGAEYVAQLPSLIAEIDAGRLGIEPLPTPLSAVEATWAAPDVPGRRVVIVP